VISHEAEDLFGGGIVNAAVLIRIETNPVTRMFFGGVGKLPVPVDTVETTGAPYIGLGRIDDAPDLDIFINGGLDRLAFSLSGVHPEHQAMAQAEASHVRNKMARIGIMGLNHRMQQATEVCWIKTVWADVVSTSSEMVGSKQRTRSVSLSFTGINADRKRPRHEYWTAAEQHMRSADDDFCNHVARYSAGATRKFP
jgi:hypothetical protein